MIEVREKNMNNKQTITLFIEKNFNILFYLGISIGFLFAFLYADNQVLTADQFQMLNKGYLGATEGVWLSYGNAASAVGNVPGSLSAYIIGVPLMLWSSPWAPMFFLIFLHYISFYLFDSVIEKVFNPSVRILFMVLYWLSPWLLFESLLYNPSYLFFFTALHFWTAFNMHQKKNFIYTFLHVLAISMAMQLHYSWPILVVISSYLIYRNIIKVNWFGFIGAIALTLISLIPYFQEALINDSIISKSSDTSDRYIGWGGVHVYPVLKAFLYWLRYGAFIFSDQITLGANFEWISNNELIRAIVQYIWRTILYVVGGISLLFSLNANRKALIRIAPLITRRSKNINISLEEWMLLYMLGALFGVLISSILSPIIFNHWHLIVIYPIALFPILSYINGWISNMQCNFKKYLLFIIPYFFIINIVAANDSAKFSYKVNYQQQVSEYLHK